ncbi:MAG: CYTH domain-containing protein, partial [Gemmatimonadales bacterium]|nr:CYTH domain-containing protein [Gemmatimonadales bacterium]
MSRPLSRELKWVVPTPELLRELVAAPLPLRLRSSSPERTFHRDIYYDTADCALSRSGVTCRLRQGSDDRRMLTLTLPSAQERLRHDSVVTELDPADSLAGESAAARRLRGLVQPAQLEALAQLHT